MKTPPGSLFLIDCLPVIHRAHHRLPHLRSPAGVPIGAVFGFAEFLEEILERERPSHMAAVFDRPEPTFRHRHFPAYKAQRPPTPRSVSVQIAPIRRLLRAYGIPVEERSGFEADDVIATLARRASRRRQPTLVVSGDKDLEQILDRHVRIYDARRGHLDPERLFEKRRIWPHQVVDYLALVGDPLDGVPGVPGVGPRTAAGLLARLGTLDAFFLAASRADREGIPIRTREKILAHRLEIERNRRLLTLRRDCPVSLPHEGLRLGEPDAAALVEIFEELQFKTLSRKYFRKISKKF